MILQIYTIYFKMNSKTFLFLLVLTFIDKIISENDAIFLLGLSKFFKLLRIPLQMN
jgi:hypothetical protein